MIVIKRDGRKVEFDLSKIISATSKAVISVGTGIDIPKKVADMVLKTLQEENKDEITIEHIQDLVEIALMKLNPDVAKCYILYRDTRSRERSKRSEINKKIAELIKIDASESDTKRENANIDGDTMCGSMLKIGGTVTKEYFFDNIIDTRFKKLHENGQIHIHDADLALFTINCLHINLKKLLAEGFSTGHGYLRSPTTIQSAATLACIALQSNQNDCFGGQAYPSIDYDLAPYVAKSFVRNVVEHLRSILSMTEPEDVYNYTGYKTDVLPVLDKYIKKHEHIMNHDGKNFIQCTLSDYLKKKGSSFELTTDVFDKICKYAETKTDRDTYQAMEAMQHNFCTLQSRSGGQTPFSSINFGTDTSEEGRMVTKNILLNVKAGLGSGETAIFPISIFKILKGVTDKGNKNYDLFRLACEVSAVRAFPNFVNVSAPMNFKYYVPGRPETEIATMGALTGSSVLHVDTDDASIDIPFKNLESYLLQNKLTTTTRKQFDEYTYYYDLVDGVYTRDSLADDNKARIKRFMVFNDPKLKWIIIKFVVTAMSLRHVPSSTYTNYIIVTSDHPLPVINEYGNTVRTRADEIKVGDLLVPARNPYASTCEVCSIEECNEQYIGYDIETSTDRFDTESIVSHNCRTRVIGNHYDKNHQQTSGRGNLFFTTINLPYIALEALEKYPDDEAARYHEFMKILDERIDDAMEVNRQRFEYISHRKAKNLPFLMGQHLYIGSENLGPEDEIGEVIKQGSISVGFIGLAETLTALFGKHHGESEKSQQYGLTIIGHMNDLMHKFSEEENMNYSLFATPAEGCSGRLLKACRKRFGIVPGVTDKLYLTNSVHVPVSYKISAFDKVNIEAPYHPLCEAGIIGYIELDYDATKNIDAFEMLVNHMADSGMTYFSINHPVDHDPVCGYFGYIPVGGVCPRCGRKEGEGVTVRRLLSLRSYSPTPEFAIDRDMLALDDAVPNEL